MHAREKEKKKEWERKKEREREREQNKQNQIIITIFVDNKRELPISVCVCVAMHIVYSANKQSRNKGEQRITFQKWLSNDPWLIQSLIKTIALLNELNVIENKTKLSSDDI